MLAARSGWRLRLSFEPPKAVIRESGAPMPIASNEHMRTRAPTLSATTARLIMRDWSRLGREPGGDATNRQFSDSEGKESLMGSVPDRAPADAAWSRMPSDFAWAASNSSLVGAISSEGL